MRYFSNLFDKVFYMFRTCPLSIIRNISTLYTQQVFVILVLLASATRFQPIASIYNFTLKMESPRFLCLLINIC